MKYPIVRLIATLVTLGNDYTTSIDTVRLDGIKSSAEAEKYARELDEGTTNHTSVLSYTVIKTGSGVFGDTVEYQARPFKNSIEPYLVWSDDSSNTAGA